MGEGLASLLIVTVAIGAVVLVGIIATVNQICQTRLKAQLLDKEQVQALEGLSERVGRLEERMANIETLLLEHDKHREFDALTREP